MLDTKALRSSAEKAFRAKVLDKVRYLSEKVWSSNIKDALEQLNEIIAAGRQLGVTDTEELPPETIARIVKELSPLRALDMAAQARDHLVNCLYAQGFEVDFFGEPPRAAE